MEPSAFHETALLFRGLRGLRQVCSSGDKDEQKNERYPFKTPSDLLLLVNFSVSFVLP